MENEVVSFFHQHLGRHLDPKATPKQSIASPKAPIVTNKVIKERQQDPSRPGIPDRVGAGIAAYYAVTDGHAWLVSQAELPQTEAVTQLMLKDAAGTPRINGMSWLAHWLADEAPADRPFIIGTLENANPLQRLALSLPPHNVTVCHSNAKLGGVSLSLQRYRQAVRVIEDNDIDWPIFKKATRLKERVWLAAQGKLDNPEREQEKARADMAKIQKKIPDILRIVNAAGMAPGSGEETMLHSYFHPKCDKGIII